jgi:hypothetical protein
MTTATIGTEAAAFGSARALTHRERCCVRCRW